MHMNDQSEHLLVDCTRRFGGRLLLDYVDSSVYSQECILMVLEELEMSCL